MDDTSINSSRIKCKPRTVKIKKYACKIFWESLNSAKFWKMQQLNNNGVSTNVEAIVRETAVDKQLIDPFLC